LAKKFTLLGNRAEDVRDQHQANIERWKENAACRAKSLCDVRLANNEPLAVLVSSSACLNASECVAEKIEYRFTITGPEVWSVRDGSSFRRTRDGIEAYVPEVDTDADTVSFFFENEDLYSSNLARFIVDFPETGTVEVLLEVFIDDGISVVKFCDETKATNLIE
jgi:hypothetical protein